MAAQKIFLLVILQIIQIQMITATLTFMIVQGFVMVKPLCKPTGTMMMVMVWVMGLSKNSVVQRYHLAGY